MSRKNNPWLWLLFVCCLIGLLSTFASFSDFDHDGLLDSIASEEFLLFPVLIGVSIYFWLLDRFPAARIAAPQHCYSKLLHPPIFSN
jgi:hypothetical protein